MTNKYIENHQAKGLDQKFISVADIDGLVFDENKFSDIENFIPVMKEIDSVYQSDVLAVLTQRPSVYGLILGISNGVAYIDQENEISWRSDDGETVVGWMYMPSTEHLVQDVNFAKVNLD
jgi:hypothetical protein